MKFRNAGDAFGDFLQVVFEQRKRAASAQVAAQRVFIGMGEDEVRIRLAQSQKVVAIAEMSSGELFTSAREVKVTIGGCGG